MEKKLYRDEHRKVIAGVCAGLADYLGIDVTIVRLVFLLTLIFKGGGLLVYIILWIVLPKRDYFVNPIVDYTVPPVVPPFGDPFVNMPPMPPKRRSSGGLIGGLILICLGSLFLLDQYNIIPDWDFEKLWPIVLIVVGAAIMFTGDRNHQPWKKFEQPGWDKKVNDPANSVVNDNPSTEQL